MPLERPALYRSTRPSRAALWLIGCICILLLASPAHALEPDPQPTLEVELVAPEALRAALEANLDIVRWSRRGGLTSGQMEQLFSTARKQVREIAATEGYFDARVEASLRRNGESRIARLEVTLGEPVLVQGVELSFTGPLRKDPQADVRMDRARRAFGFVPGERFRQVEWDAGKARALRSIARTRYGTATLASSEARIDPERRTAHLKVVIDSGPPVTMGAPRISGLQRYDERLVRNLNPIPPGADYDEDELLKYQRRLLASGYFGSAIVASSPSRDAPADTPILVSLVESESRRIEMGVGYSTDRGARAQASYRDNNLFDKAWRLNTRIAVDRLVQELNAGIAFPRLPSGIHYGIETELRAEDIQGQDILNWSLTGGRQFLTEEYESSLSLQFLSERSRLDDGPEDNRSALFLNQRWLWNTLNDPINPRRGYTFQFQAGGALQGVLSTQTFARLHTRANYLYPFNRNWTLALRAEAGAVLAESRDNIPSAYVFRTGGDASIRGYAYESLGVQEADAVVGGRYLLVGSVELMRWLNRQWGIGAFVDGGNAWDELSDFEAVYGYGAGVRWRSPLGNLSLDLAHGEATDEWRVHFSAGLVLR